MTTFDAPSRAVILSIVYGALGNAAAHSYNYGLYKVNNLSALNLALHLSASRLNRSHVYQNHPVPSQVYTNPYVCFCYTGAGNVDLIQLHEYEPSVQTSVVEWMLASGEIKFGTSTTAPPPFAPAEITEIIPNT